MYRFLLTRRWIAIHLFCLALMPLMVWLGFWQWHRYEHAHHNNQILSRNLSAAPRDYTAVARPGREVTKEQTWLRVRATGRYDSAHELFVRRRIGADGDVGFDVLTPLVTRGGATVLVNRGWVKSPDDPAANPTVPKAPTGEVTVTGRLRPDEEGDRPGAGSRLGLPDRQVMQINGAELASALGGTAPLPGYLELTGTSPKPAEGPEVPGPPDPDNTGLHVAYTLNWWVFVAGVPIAWWRLMKRERDDRARAAAAGGAAGPGSGSDPESPDGSGRAAGSEKAAAAHGS